MFTIMCAVIATILFTVFGISHLKKVLNFKAWGGSVEELEYILEACGYHRIKTDSPSPIVFKCLKNGKKIIKFYPQGNWDYEYIFADFILEDKIIIRCKSLNNLMMRVISESQNED